MRMSVYSVCLALALSGGATAAHAQVNDLLKGLNKAVEGVRQAPAAATKQVAKKKLDLDMPESEYAFACSIKGKTLAVAKNFNSDDPNMSVSLGKRDPKSADPMKLDTIFRAYSMTKPFASVAAMTLIEDGVLQLGDTLTEGEALQYTGLPFFAPELFQTVELKNPMKSKQLQAGLLQLGEEGAIQVFRPIAGSVLLLGAVGQLQFEVVAFRLQDEYSVQCVFEGVPVATARWIECDDAKKLAEFRFLHHVLSIVERCWKFSRAHAIFYLQILVTRRPSLQNAIESLRKVA